jgi:hypothetical protein
VSQYASGPGPPAATGAHAWTRIARVQPPHAGHTAPAGAENASVGTGIQDRGLGPGRYHGPGLGQGRGSEIIMGASQGRARGRDLGTGDVRGLAQDRGPVLVPPRRPARDRGPGPSHAIGEADTESAHADLAPEVSPRVAAAAVAGTANGGEREVARRMYVFLFFCLISALVVLSGGPPQREKRERKKNGMASAAALGGQWGKYGIISESEYVRIFYSRRV